MSLGGVMIWDISQDDYNNDCGNGSYPLLNAIANLTDVPYEEAGKLSKFTNFIITETTSSQYL